MLAHAYRETRRFPTYYGGLVVPRDAPFGFLREGSEAWLDRVALKTGSMDAPHSVLGIAGYLRKRKGGWIAFAAIVNGGADAAPRAAARGPAGRAHRCRGIARPVLVRRWR